MARYTVLVDDNARHADAGARRELGGFERYEEALAAARGVVERCLRELHRPGMSAGALLAAYRSFGEDPFIVPDDGAPPFSAWTYAQARCREIRGAG